MFQFSKSSIERMRDVNEELIMVFMEAIKVSPIDFGIPEHGGLRSAGVQNTLYTKKVSNCDGYEKLSNHQSGNALDFYAYIGKASWNKVHLAMVAAVILSTGKRLKEEGKISITLKWGGQFGSNKFHGWDYPHIEVVV